MAAKRRASESSPPQKKTKLPKDGHQLANVITCNSSIVEIEDSQIELTLPRYLSSIFKEKEETVTDTNNELLSVPLFSSPDDKSDHDSSGPFHDDSTPPYAPPNSCSCLADCNVAGSLVSILALVTQVNPLTEVVVKSGFQVGQTISMSSLLVADPSLGSFKLTLWKESALWWERLSAGDIILLSNIRIKKWKKEIVGHTMMLTKLLNLHQPRHSPSSIRDTISCQCFSQFLTWAKKEHFYLFNRSVSTKNSIAFTESKNFLFEALVHFRGKLTNIISDKVLVMVDDPTNEVLISLVGETAGRYLHQLRKGLNKVWDVHYVFVLPEGTQTGFHYLQSTGRTYIKLTDHSLAQAVQSCGINTLVKSVTLKELTYTTESGCYTVSAKATSINVTSTVGNSVDLCQIIETCDNEKLLKILSECMYVGCQLCTVPLQQDDNNVYCLCSHCNQRSFQNDFSCVRFFKSASIVLSGPDDSSFVCDVSSSTLAELLTCPNVIASSIDNLQQVKIIGDLLRDCVRKMKSEKKWTICFKVLTDENSFILSHQSTLLNFN